MTRAPALLLILLASCGKPIVPGQHTQACVNRALGLSAPPPVYVRVARDQVRAEHDAYFVGGRVALTAQAGPRTGRHEAVRQAVWHDAQRQPTREEFYKAERQCGAKRRRW